MSVDKNWPKQPPQNQSTSAKSSAPMQTHAPTPAPAQAQAPIPLVDAATYELGQALRQVHASEQSLRRELREAKERNTKLESSLKFQQEEFQTKTKAMEAELNQTKKLLATRENQLRGILSEKDAQTNRELEEKKHLTVQLDQATQRANRLAKQYNELYEYCESLLAEAEGRRKDAESEAARLVGVKTALETKVQELEASTTQLKQSYSAVMMEKRAWEVELNAKEDKISQLSTQLSTQVEQLTRQLDDTKSRLEEANRSANRGKFENAQLETRLKLFGQLNSLSGSQLSRARDILFGAVKSMADMQTSTKGFIENLASKGATPLSIRGGMVIADQWQMELENLRKLDALLVELLEAQKKAQEESSRLQLAQS
jgi:DNA repair exonuclease SbcCD ATPase subunit